MKAALVVILFAASAFAQKLSVAAAEAACGPVDTAFVVKANLDPHALQQPDPGRALVYVIEEQKFKAFNDVTARVGLDGTWVGANHGNSYLFFSVDLANIICARIGRPTGSQAAGWCRSLR